MAKTNEEKVSGARERTSDVPNTNTSTAKVISKDEMAERRMIEMLNIHSELSAIDFERHRKRFDGDLSNAISFLSQSAQSLQKYLKGRAAKEIYGTEKTE
jgi:hypothetical protein